MRERSRSLRIATRHKKLFHFTPRPFACKGGGAGVGLKN